MLGLDWVPVSVAASEIGVSRQRVYQLIEQGKLMARKIGNTWMISQASVRDLMRRRALEGG